MERLRIVRSRTVVLQQQNIDTDQIIPARFLKTTERRGLGQSLFADWRYDAAGAPRPDFALNRPEARGASILVAGDNFGCGSSREHAPWALIDAGFRAVISSSIADIFRNNAAKNGLLAVVVPAELHAALLAAPGATVTVDLERRTVEFEGAAPVSFPIDPFARHCLLEGVDELGFLLRQDAAISRFEGNRTTP